MKQIQNYPIIYNNTPVDWHLWIERTGQSEFLVSIFHEVEGQLMEKITGKGFLHQLCIKTGNVYYWMRSKKDLQSMAQKHLEFLSHQSKDDLNKFFNNAFSFSQQATSLIQRSSKLTDKKLLKEKDAILKEVKNILLFTTSLPYFLLAALETTTPKKFDNYEIVKSNSEKLRSDSKYPELKERILDRFDEHKNVEQKLIFWLDPESKKTESSSDPLLIETIENFIEKIEQVNEVTGTIASVGYAQGIVKIVNVKSDMAKVASGDIVLSRNTNPSLMPALILSGAIVTDEGGMGCHAAIVSRELKKPCIVGTKTSTKIFKDGDLVEVDAHKGIIKKIPST